MARVNTKEYFLLSVLGDGCFYKLLADVCYFPSAQENPPPYPSQGSLDKKSRDSDRDSLDDYGEGPQFNEDGSFIEEYGDEKKPAPDEKDQSAFATFV